MPGMPTDPWIGTDVPVPLQRPAIPIAVYRFNPDAVSSSTAYQLLDNVECVDIQQEMGIDPGRARFRYRFTGLDGDAPRSIEEALSSSVVLPKTILVADRLLVLATQPGGSVYCAFYGFALVFELGLGPHKENVEIGAVGIAKGAWDRPIGGQFLRDCTRLASGATFDSDVPAQFNPKGRPNCTPAGSEINADPTNTLDLKYRQFMDPAYVHDPDVRVSWTLALAARYLIFKHAALDADLTVPEGTTLDALLVSRVPIAGTSFDPTNAATYTATDILVSDRPLTGRDWPTALNELIRDKGFGMAWQTGASPGPTGPTTTLGLFLLQGGTLKSIYLQPRGSLLDPNLSNVAEARIARDVNQLINRWDVKGALKRYEASFVLAPGFPMAAADGATLDALAAFDRTGSGFDANSDAYRLFVFDETGEGHHNNASNAEINTVTSLDAILGAPAAGGAVKYIARRRKPIGELISTDVNNKPNRYRLSISTDYAGAYPAVWDRSGHWQAVDGEFALLKDRLGIRITATNPNGWKVGKCEDANAPYPMGVVKVVESLCSSNTANLPFFLRLTAVIEGDSALTGSAAQTTSSILPNTIGRQIDARDRFQLLTVCASSDFNDGSPDIVARDDTKPATAEAVAHRTATEAGILRGEVAIPRFTMYYQIGDRIRAINGRNLGLQTNATATTNTNAATYPVVVGIRWVLEKGQRTILTLSDQDGHRHTIESKIKRH